MTADSQFVRTFDLINRLVSVDVGWRQELIHFRALESENKFAVFINPMAPHESPLNAFRSNSLAHSSPPGFQNEKCCFEAATARQSERWSGRGSEGESRAFVCPRLQTNGESTTAEVGLPAQETVNVQLSMSP